MEIARSCTRRKRHNRLLNLFFIVAFSLFSIHIFAQNTSSFQFQQAGDFVVSGESHFSINIENISPSDIRVITRAYPEGVTFVSSTKNDDFIQQDGVGSTKVVSIVYTLRFTKEGVYDLGSLPVMLNSQLQSIDFPVVTVYPNPNLLVPELVFEQTSDFYALHEGTFRISARYFKSIESLMVEPSEHALIAQQDALLQIPSSDIAFTNVLVPVAIFSCTPFSSGSFTLPNITLSCTAYNGTSYDIQLSEKTISVKPTEDYSAGNYGNERATTLSASTNTITTVIEKKVEVVDELAALRIQEKYNLFPFDARAKRINLERQENIQNESEISYIWTMLAIGFSVAVLFFGFVLYKVYSKKSKLLPGYVVLLCIAAVLLLFGSLFYGRTLSKNYALVYGTQLYTIPEYESNIVTSLYAGMRVQVKSSAGDWYLVSLLDGRTGWVLKSDCIPIEKDEDK